MAAVPETRFAETPGGRIAYQVVGDGPINVLVTHSPVFPIDHMWDEPSLVRFLDRLSSFSRHVWFDPRGWGASDPLLLMARTLSGGKRLTSANPQCGGQERRVAVSIRELLDKMAENLSVRRSFSDAYKRDGGLIIPVAPQGSAALLQ